MTTRATKTAGVKGTGTKTVKPSVRGTRLSKDLKVKILQDQAAALRAELDMLLEQRKAAMSSKLRAQHDDPEHLRKVIRSSEEALVREVDEFLHWDLMSNVIEKVGHWFSAYVGNPQQPWNEEPRGQALSNETYEYVRLITFLSKIGEVFNEGAAYEAQLKISTLASE